MRRHSYDPRWQALAARVILDAAYGIRIRHKPKSTDTSIALAGFPAQVGECAWRRALAVAGAPMAGTSELTEPYVENIADLDR